MITKTLLALAFIAFVAGSPVLAHHSANAQFDTKQDVTLIGVVTKVENINPHSWWHLEVKGSDGKITKWKLDWRYVPVQDCAGVERHAGGW